MVRVTVLFFVVVVALASEGAKWKYGETGPAGYGPKDWYKVSKHCKESAQSPININSRSAKKDSNLKGLSFTCDDRYGFVSGKIVNNGHSPTLNIDKAKGSCVLTGGPLGNSKYKLQQLHFHFGCEDDRGSEHTVDGKASSGELHLVTYNTKYPDFATAADKTDGLSVIGVFLQGGDDDDDDDDSSYSLRLLAMSMWRIRKADADFPAKTYLYNLVPQLTRLSKTPFYSYKGSLTTPPCYQSVKWIVLQKAISAGEREFYAMRYLQNHEEHSMCDNFRPPQPLNGRKVSKYSG